MDHFARLGLPAALDLDAAALDRAYFAGQRQWHPDRFARKSPEERARASAEAAALNDAYRTLKDPLARAIYLATLKGVDLPGDGKTIDDPELLMEVMDAREELQEATSVGEVDALARFAREDLEKALASLKAMFAANDKAAIRKTLLRMRYLDKFAEEARSRRSNIGQGKA
jgi:molecular chaperone HscB